MREIKFRVWDIYLKKFKYINQPNDFKFWMSNYCDNPKSEWPDMQQFTGLHDKNGKEIYEGDIISPCLINACITHCEVIFANGCFYKKQIGAEGFIQELYKHLNHCEIIGNIHENPELIK